MKSDDATKGSADTPERQDGTLSADELRAIGSAITRDFPLTAGHPSLVLMDVDPLHLHVYWYQDPAAIDVALGDMAGPDGRAHLVLRFRDIPDSHAVAGVSKAVTAFDREIHAPSGHEQVKVPSAGHCYEVELGVTAEDGGWRILACSNRVCMPPAGPTREMAERTVSLAGPELPRVAGPTQAEHGPAVQAMGSTEIRDPSLRPGATSVLEPDFPSVVRSPEAQEPESTSGAEMAVLPDVPVHDPGPEEDRVMGLPGDPGQGIPSLSSPALAARRLQTGSHLYGRGNQGLILELYGRQIKVDEDGGFDLLRGVDPSNPCIAMLFDNS